MDNYTKEYKEFLSLLDDKLNEEAKRRVENIRYDGSGKRFVYNFFCIKSILIRWQPELLYLLKNVKLPEVKMTHMELQDTGYAAL